MKIDTRNFGELEVNPDAILTFPRGLPGLERCSRFQLLREDKEGPVVYYLQSLDDPAIAFSIVDPALYGFNYELTLSDEEADLLQSGSPDKLVVMLMVYKPHGTEGEAAFPGGVSANINGPLVLNLEKKLGMQKVLIGPKYDITLRDSGSA
ncbi:MAG: flagellar assembly protein FliW [Sulfurimicrobium sp.]|jgi:flagellar assembly factor FliW|nr:flagellar assembly protein FliW [Sulfurimicrobium sp.]MDZ7654720.1 flagellar assembly protein FliW [Sulfurimicrobium sp.]